MNFYLLKFKVYGDQRGNLVSLESSKNIPFDIKRVYYIWATDSQFVRGKHAHTQLEQVLVCVSGSCNIKLDDGIITDDKNNIKEIILKNPTEGLYIGKNIWREMYNFSHDCVLMVIASELYNEQEYIRDYEIFLSTVKNNN